MEMDSFVPKYSEAHITGHDPLQIMYFVYGIVTIKYFKISAPRSV